MVCSAMACAFDERAEVDICSRQRRRRRRRWGRRRPCTAEQLAARWPNRGAPEAQPFSAVHRCAAGPGARLGCGLAAAGVADAVPLRCWNPKEVSLRVRCLRERPVTRPPAALRYNLLPPSVLPLACRLQPAFWLAAVQRPKLSRDYRISRKLLPAYIELSQNTPCISLTIGLQPQPPPLLPLLPAAPPWPPAALPSALCTRAGAHRSAS